MSTPPRRRRPDARPPKPDGGGWLPTIAMGIGVVVAGLGIGALVAVLMQRSGEKLPAATRPVAVVTSTPANPATRGPIAIATLVPPRTPRPLRSPSPSVTPHDEPSANVAPTPSVEPSPSVAPTANVAPTPSVEPSRELVVVSSAAPTSAPATPTTVAAAVPSATIAPRRVAAITPAPPRSPNPAQAASIATQSPAAVPPAQVAPAPNASSPAASTYDQHASAVVRRYVDALIRGDDKTAYGAFGGGGGTLSEQAFLDPGARIVFVKVTRIDDSNASVGCEIASAKGHYYATYHVTAGSGGPYISQHDYIKV